MIDCSKLLELQKFDLALDEIDQKIHKTQAKSDRLAAEITKEEQLINDKEALLKKISLRRKKAELELNEANDKIKTNELRMQRPGMAPDVYQALEKEIGGYREKGSALETRILEDMEKIESLTKDVEKSKKVLGGRKGQLDDNRASTAGAIKDLKAEREGVYVKRQQMSLTIEAGILEKYETLRHKTKGRVIHDIDKPGCPACGMSLPNGFVRQISGSIVAEHCPECDILLRWTGMLDGVHVS